MRCALLQRRGCGTLLLEAEVKVKGKLVVQCCSQKMVLQCFGQIEVLWFIMRGCIFLIPLRDKFALRVTFSETSWKETDLNHCVKGKRIDLGGWEDDGKG